MPATNRNRTEKAPEGTTATVADVHRALLALADPKRAPGVQRFFKTGPGEYGEGDRFLGVRVPDLRKLATKYESLPLAGAGELLQSPLHEERLLALLLLVRRYSRGDGDEREAIHRLYLDRMPSINSWDLVDLSAPRIVGAHLEHRDRSLLDSLATAGVVWERRIAILATYHYIQQGDFTDTFRLAEMLLRDRHDLIHKAVGWMLREVGRRDRPALESFLRDHHRVMPRTMLRYAIEKLPEGARRMYMKGTA
jgi:3-methyladenine DNA glycosylase AlkD